MISPPATKPIKQRRRNQWYIVWGVLAVLALGVAWAAQNLFSKTASSTQPVTPAKQTAPVNAQPESRSVPTAESPLIADDGRTLWASPTAGKPLDLRYLPPGCSLILALRPSELLSQGEGARFVAALGPRGAERITHLEKILGAELSQIEQLLIGVRGAPNQKFEICLVATFRNPRELNTIDDWSVYSPARGTGNKFVFGNPETIEEVKKQGDAPPLLRRELEQLVRSTDSERQITLLLAPNFLFADGKKLFTGLAGPIREPLFNQLRDELRAVSISANWSSDFFVELRAIATSDLTPTQLAAQLAEQVSRWPQLVEDAVLGLSVNPHGRRVVARLPAMTRALANYTRSGVEEDQAVLRSYLPLAAGHNLLMAAELLLAQQAAGPSVKVNRSTLAATKPLSVAEKLQKETTLRFDRDTLEMALKLLSQEIGVEIVLVGKDLQLDGITKNQSFGIDVSDQPAEKILQEIVRLANPDKTATSLADVKQKLVYVVKPQEPGGEKVIFVTTRSQAALRKDELPAVFERSAP